VHGVSDAEHQIRVSGTARGETHERVPYDEEQRRTDSVKEELAKDLRGNESRPAVHSAWPFSDLINPSGPDEGTLHLVG
jgi:hypothetical protein